MFWPNLPQKTTVERLPARLGVFPQSQDQVSQEFHSNKFALFNFLDAACKTPAPVGENVKIQQVFGKIQATSDSFFAW